MEQITGTTPNKVHMNYETALSYSPRLHKTPVKQKEFKRNEVTYSKNADGFTVLPSHMTPPSGLTKFIARNPFEPDLTNRLHLSVISPTVFSKFSSPPQDTNCFAWSIDELALIQPAIIEEVPGQQIHNSDPEVEVKAQAAIDKFFDANEIVPSPWEGKRKENRASLGMCTPIKIVDNSTLSKDVITSKKEGWSQTILSLPPELPSEVEEALKPYFTFNQEQSTDTDDANLSNSSLRRKLFFNNDDCVEHEEESSISLSPDKANTSLALICSPPQSGMFVHGTPLKKCSKRLQQLHGTPTTNLGNLSPPNMSPIANDISEMSYKSVKSRFFSVTKLDFTTEMNFEHSFFENKTHLQNTESMDTCTRMLDKKSNIKVVCHPANPVEDSNHRKTEVDVEKELDSNLIQLKSNEKHTRHSVPSQDTGYHTYSNTTSITESYKMTPIKDKLHENNRILSSVDGMSDWKENIKNVFSSTPSRLTGERYN